MGNDTSNPSICFQYYLLKINFHKGTYSQDVETLTPGEEYFSVVGTSKGVGVRISINDLFSLECMKNVNQFPVIWHGTGYCSAHLNYVTKDKAGKR